jgi:fructoselysine 3-epimerase
MKIGYFTAGASKYPIEKAFELVAKYGYDGIEIGGFRPHAFPLDLVHGDAVKIRKLADQYHLPVISYAPENTGSPYSLVFEDKRLNQESLEYFKIALDAAKQIGAGYCMLACNHPGYGRYKEDVKRLFIDNLKVLAEHAEKIGQTIILEPVTPYEGTILVTSDDLKWALDEINSPMVKGMLDLACPLIAREPVSEYFRKLRKKVCHIHFIDATIDSEDHLIPGDGQMDFKGIVRMLKEFGYDGYLTLELFTRYETEPEFAAARAIKVIRSLLSEEA